MEEEGGQGRERRVDLKTTERTKGKVSSLVVSSTRKEVGGVGRNSQEKEQRSEREE